MLMLLPNNTSVCMCVYEQVSRKHKYTNRMNRENVQPKRESRDTKEEEENEEEKLANKTTDQTDTIRYDTKYQSKKEMEFVVGKWTETKTNTKMKMNRKNHVEYKRMRNAGEQEQNSHTGHIEAENSLARTLYSIHYYYMCV